MNKSESIANLAKALSAFQAEVPNPKNTANNPFFKSKYAPLCDVLTLVRPLLTKHGLSIVQFPSGSGDNITITTSLLHSSGEWIEGDPLILKADKATAQGAGSAISYGRRYSVSAVLGISSEDDDDGNHATGNGEPKPQTNKPAPPKQEPKVNKATEAQIKKMFASAKQRGVPDSSLKARVAEFGKSSSRDLTVEECSQIITWIENYNLEEPNA